MENRRNFLKSIFGGLCVSLVAPFTKSAMAQSLSKAEEQLFGPTRSGITWRQNIFCQFDHANLREAVEKCAIETDSTVFYGTNGDPDIHACPAFVMIVDRNAVGFDLWLEYVEYSDINGDDIPCFVIDNIHNLPFPKKKYCYQFDLNNGASIPIIIKTITEMKKDMDRRLPGLFRGNSSYLSLPE